MADDLWHRPTLRMFEHRFLEIKDDPVKYLHDIRFNSILIMFDDLNHQVCKFIRDHIVAHKSFRITLRNFISSFAIPHFHTRVSAYSAANKLSTDAVLSLQMFRPIFDDITRVQFPCWAIWAAWIANIDAWCLLKDTPEELFAKYDIPSMTMRQPRRTIPRLFRSSILRLPKHTANILQLSRQSTEMV